MRCNRNQFQKELMRGLESTTGGMKAVELQARLTMIILTVIRLTVAGLTMTGLRVAVRTMALPTMDMLSCVPPSCRPKALGASLPPYSPALATSLPPSLLTAYSLPTHCLPIPTTTYPLTLQAASPGSPRGDKSSPFEDGGAGRASSEGGGYSLLPWLGVAPNPNPNPNPTPTPSPNPNPNQVLALRRRLGCGPRPHLFAASGAAATRPQVGRRGRRGRQGTGGGAFGGARQRGSG